MLRFTIILLLLDVGVCHYRYHCINSLHLTSHLYFLANIFLKLTKTLSLFAVWTCVIFIQFFAVVVAVLFITGLCVQLYVCVASLVKRLELEGTM